MQRLHHECGANHCDGVAQLTLRSMHAELSPVERYATALAWLLS